MEQGEVASINTPITKEFLERILKREIVNFKVSTGTKPGDNYTSILLSLEVQVVSNNEGEETLHFLFKTFPEHPTRRKLMQDGNVFRKENEFYSIWIPELMELQRNVIQNEPVLVPAMPELVAGEVIDYQKVAENSIDISHLNPILSNYLLMVDVRKYGYQMASKLKSLDYHQVKVVLEELAKYHALGHAYKTYMKVDSLAGKFRCLECRYFCLPEAKPIVAAIMKPHVQLILDTCKDFLEEHVEIAKSLSKFKDPVLAGEYLAIFSDPKGMDEEKVEGFMRTKSEKYGGPPLEAQWVVPVHGDCWTNNALFKNDAEGHATSAVLVDQQLARESCITVDITYFLFTSTDTNFRKQYLDEMLLWYYNRFVHFSGILKTPLFPGFTLDNLQRKYHRSKIFGLMFAIMGLPLVLQRPETATDRDLMEAREVDEVNYGEEFGSLFHAAGLDDDDLKMLRERFVDMLAELYGEGIL